MSGPLAGVRVVDLSNFYAGPLCASSLAELGADVIKVERPGGGDPARSVAPGSHHVLNRDKEVVVADLTELAERCSVLGLMDRADVVIESFRPGGASKLGVGEADIRVRNPCVIYCSINGLGPGSDAGAHDVDVAARSGLLWMTGDGAYAPSWGGAIPYVDVASAGYAVQGILAALFQRERTGAGASLEVSMLEVALKIAEPRFADYYMAGSPTREVFLDRSGYGAFSTRDGRRVAIACVTDSEWVRFLQLPECASIRDHELLISAEARKGHAGEVRNLLTEVFKTQSAEVWLSTLSLAGLAASPVSNPEELAQDPIVVSLGGQLSGAEIRLAYPVRGLGGRQAEPSHMREQGGKS